MKLSHVAGGAGLSLVAVIAFVTSRVQEKAASVIEFRGESPEVVMDMLRKHPQGGSEAVKSMTRRVEFVQQQTEGKVEGIVGTFYIDADRAQSVFPYGFDGHTIRFQLSDGTKASCDANCVPQEVTDNTKKNRVPQREGDFVFYIRPTE